MLLHSNLRHSSFLLCRSATCIPVASDTRYCSRLYNAVQWCTAVSISATTLLFLFRVRAVYKNSPIVSRLFFFSWLCVVAACLIQTQISPLIEADSGTERCVLVGGGQSFFVAATLAPMVNDFLIFCAITCKLMGTMQINDPTAKTKIMSAIFGTYLPAFSKTLLQDGQAYLL